MTTLMRSLYVLQVSVRASTLHITGTHVRLNEDFKWAADEFEHVCLCDKLDVYPLTHPIPAGFKCV